MDDMQFVGFFDIDYQKSKMMAEQYNCNSFETIDDLMENIDSVVIASPNNTHFKYFQLAINCGKNALCEKPLAVDEKEAIEMCNMAKKFDKQLAVGFNYRYLPIMALLKSHILNQLGPMKHMELSFLKDSAYRKKCFQWRDSCDHKGTSGALGDLGIHLFDLLMNIGSSMVDISSLKPFTSTRVSQKGLRRVEVDDHSTVEGVLENGISFNILASKAYSGDDQGLNIRICCDKGIFDYKSKYQKNYLITDHNENTTIHEMEHTIELPDPINEVYGWSDTFKLQISDWLPFLKSNERLFPNIASMNSALYAQSILSACLKINQYETAI
jgi:glucose-6-phosphate 3-dehydrogenase